MKRFIVVPCLAFGLLAACSDVGNSGSAGVGSRSDIGISNASNGGGWNNLVGDPATRQASAYRNELRAENSN